MTYAQNTPGIALPALTPAVKRLLILNGIVFLVNMVLGGRLDGGSGHGYGWFALSWDGLWEGYGLGVLRLFTYQVTHSFADPFHLLWNMLILYFFGTMAERSLGYRGTYKLYLTSGLIAGALFMGLGALQGELHRPVVGASGCCYGFLVYAACVAPRSTVLFLFIPIQLRVLAGILVALGVYLTYRDLYLGASGVAHSAHVGGALWGFVAHRFGWFRDWEPYVAQPGLLNGFGTRVKRWRRARNERHRQQREATMEQLLDKIHRQGMTSLTGAERRFLERMSDSLKKQ